MRDADQDLAKDAAAVVPRAAPIPPATEEQRVVMRQAIDFYRELDSMVADAQLLADYSVIANEDGTRKLKNPTLLAMAHRMRATNLNLALRHAEMVWNVERQQEMLEELVDAVKDVDKDLGCRVVDRLRGVQQRWNLSA
ncbi:protein of unknown function [Burkholderia multivorans]